METFQSVYVWHVHLFSRVRNSYNGGCSNAGSNGERGTHSHGAGCFIPLLVHSVAQESEIP